MLLAEVEKIPFTKVGEGAVKGFELLKWLRFIPEEKIESVSLHLKTGILHQRSTSTKFTIQENVLWVKDIGIAIPRKACVKVAYPKIVIQLCYNLQPVSEGTVTMMLREGNHDEKDPCEV